MTSSATQWPAHGCAIRSVDPACAEEMPQILYIMGTGRSGTTILEVLLANEKDIVGSGELKHIFRDAFLRNLPCACGKRSHACDWWSAVRKETGWSDADCRRYRDAIEAIERHRNFLRILSGCVLRHEWDVYEQGTTTLFRALGRLSRARVVVDSSKYPGRALMLARLFPRHVRVLCITRSAYGLIAAFQKQNDEEQRPKHPIAAAAYYVYVLLCMRLARTRLGDRCLSIRFEDLTRDPVGVLSRIERWSGVSLARVRQMLAAGEMFRVGHVVTGNRLRKQGVVKFDPSVARTDGSPPRLLAWILERYRALLGF